MEDRQQHTGGTPMPARVSAKLLTAALLFSGLFTLAACGGLEWPPPQAKPRAANMPPLPAKSPTVPSSRYSPASAPVDETVVVERGDSIHSIARRLQVPVRALVDANGLEQPYRLTAGQRLFVPRSREHYVAAGENIDTIAIRYGVDRYDLARANAVAPPYELQAGQRLSIPPSSATVVAANAATFTSVGVPPVMTRTTETVPLGISATSLPPPVAVGAVEEPEVNADAGAVPSTSQPTEVAAAIPTSPVRSGRGFLWPVMGKVISNFGDKANGMRNDGVNIAAPSGSPVVAVENGVVTYAGNELRGFGNLILIKHDDGWITAYAHTDAPVVKRGDEVKKGQTIARVGATGNVREPQLHFELRRGKAPVDPLRHLPRARA